MLQSAVAQTVGLGAMWGGVSTALAVSLDRGETAEVFRYLDRHYDDHYHGRLDRRGRLEVLECRRSLGENVIGEVDVADSSRHGNGANQRAEH